MSELGTVLSQVQAIFSAHDQKKIKLLKPTQRLQKNNMTTSKPFWWIRRLATTASFSMGFMECVQKTSRPPTASWHVPECSIRHIRLHVITHKPTWLNNNNNNNNNIKT